MNQALKKKDLSRCHIEHFELRRLLSTVFVSAAAPGLTHDGSSWSNAYTDLQVALTAATSGTTIEVGQGTYKPSAGIVPALVSPATSTDRNVTFRLIDGVTIQGGYAGPGQSNPDARDVTLYPTILSGDLGAAGDNSDNSYHVVTGNNTDSTAVLDGVTVTGGNANQSTNQSGGGIEISSGSPTLNDCIITGNNASLDGGGIDNGSSSAVLTDCVISQNTAGRNGGGINTSSSSPNLTDCTLTGNTASYGGAIYSNNSSPVLTNCILTGNSANSGGALQDNSSHAHLTNCILSGNSATNYGGAVLENSSSSVFLNCTFTGNSAANDGGGIFNNSSSSTLTNSILWNDSADSDNEVLDNSGDSTITFSDIDQSGIAGTNNIDADPLFVRNAHGSDFGDLRLQVNSPVFNIGSNAATAGISTDLDGRPRIRNSIVDIGAYESQPILYVDASATGINDGSSWTNAFTTLTAALSYALPGNQSIDVAQGTYKPTTTSDRTATFQLVDDVNVYGGFAGATTSTPNTRDTTLYPTILSGDIGTVGSNADNSFHVINATASSIAALDGFTITGGNASGTGNDGRGGGIINLGGQQRVTDCTITGNSAGYGGGIYDGSNGNLLLTNCIITGNTATGGGAMYNRNSSPTLIDTIIAGNTAQGSGGIANFYSPITLIDCTITGNTATTFDGGGIYNYSSTSTVTNCILWGDSAHSGGNEIDIGFNGGAIVSFTDIDQDDFAPNAGNIDVDPAFVRGVGANGSSDFGDLHLLGTSHAINGGSNAAITGTTTDLDGNARIIEGKVDMGAYEAFPTHLVISTQPPATSTAGADLPIVIRVEDQYGDVFSGDSSHVTIDSADEPAGATLDGVSGVIAQHGVATFNNFSLSKVGSYTLTFSSDGSLPIATSNRITITHASPASLTIIHQPADAVAGQTISPVTVQVEDQFGNLVDGANVNLSIAGGPAGSTLAGTLTASTTTAGLATFNNLTLDHAGTFTIAASDGLSQATTSSFAITYNRPQLVFIATPATAVAGAKISTIRISPEDINGVPITSNKSSIKLVLSAGGKAISTITAIVKNGVALFTPPIIQKAGTYKLTATDPSFSAISTTFTVTSAAATSIAFNSQTFKVTHAKPFNVVVKLFDRYGNLATTNLSTVKLLLGSHPAKTSLPTLTATVVNGMADFVGVTLGVRGQYSLEVTDQKLKATSSLFVVK